MNRRKHDGRHAHVQQVQGPKEPEAAGSTRRTPDQRKQSNTQHATARSPRKNAARECILTREKETTKAARSPPPRRRRPNPGAQSPPAPIPQQQYIHHTHSPTASPCRNEACAEMHRQRQKRRFVIGNATYHRRRRWHVKCCNLITPGKGNTKHRNSRHQHGC